MSKYDPHSIEQKWQSRWDQKQVFKALNPGDAGFDPARKPFYVLDMFPYPSGSGLHVGHASGYIGTDIIARKKRMEGFNVLHPMGWDAFGLPAEQYAIQTNQHPRKTTDVNTANFRRQLQLIGLSYDWSREIDTSDPAYYKWTQWIFVQLYKKGLVYRKEVPVWWCEELKTVLANEEVINGRSERGNYPCIRKPLVQWVFKITEYADRLLEDLKDLDWPENVKKMQADWIGRSIGAEIKFGVEGQSETITVFSTRPDTLFGVSAIVLAPEHPLVSQLVTAGQREAVEKYIRTAAAKSDRERKAEVSVSAEFIGAYCQHPLVPNEKIPIYIADYVLFDYGTGAVMAVPAHDERDFALAKACQLPIKTVVVPAGSEKSANDSCFTGEGVLINSGEFTSLSSEKAREQITHALERKNMGSEKVSYKIRDWIFSRQRYWGEPFPLMLAEDGSVVVVDEDNLPVLLPEMEDFKPSEDGSSPLARAEEWVNTLDPKTQRALKRVTDTMPGWAGSCWYYLRFMDPHNEKQAFSSSAVNYWKQVDLYIGGASHAVMHLLYSRFWHKALYDLGLVPEKEPFKRLFNQGMVTAFAYRDQTGRLVPTKEVKFEGGVYRNASGELVQQFISKMAKSLGNVVNPDDVIREKGCDVFRLYEMFMGPLDTDKPWAEGSIAGTEKFLKRVWKLLNKEEGQVSASGEGDKKIWRSLHKALKRVDDSFQVFNFNTAIAGLMEALNEIESVEQSLTLEQAKFFIKMLAPFAPHISSELWEQYGESGFIDLADWPKLDVAMLQQDEFELIMQVNGKLRKKAIAPVGLTEAAAFELATQALAEHLKDKQIVKRIYVPNKIVNLVIK